MNSQLEGRAERIRAFAECGPYKRVALEMGDEHLGEAVPLLALLGDSRRFVVQGERWHGGCCVDTVGDAHVAADAAVHFGEWCFSLPRNLALLVEPGEGQLPELPGDPPRGARLMYHLSLSHHHAALAAYAQRFELLFDRTPLEFHPPDAIPPQHMYDSEVPVLYVSPVAEDPRSLLLSLACPDLVLAGPSRVASSLFFSRRIGAVKKCRETRATALLAVSPGADGTASELLRLAQQVRDAGRVPYTLCVGKAGPIKLLNLPGLSVFVLVGCPMSTLLLSQSLASAVCTLVTPLEHELACRSERDWKPVFLFGNIGEKLPNSSDEEEEDEKPGSRAIVFTGNEKQIALVSPAAALLRQPGRWLGVDPSVENLEAKAAVPGRSGIASEYQHEPDYEQRAAK